MAKYPEWSDIQFDFPTVTEVSTRTLISTFDGLGKEKRRRKFNFARKNITVDYSQRFLTRAQVRTLWQFYLDRGGAYQAFSFFVTGPTATISAAGGNVYEGEYIGVGDGTTLAFDLPGRAVQNETIYHNGVEYIGSDYNISGEAGADGADKVSLLVTPAAGQILTIDFTGILRIRCRFREDRMTYRDFYNVVAQTGIELKGLLNDE